MVKKQAKGIINIPLLPKGIYGVNFTVNSIKKITLSDDLRKEFHLQSATSYASSGGGGLVLVTGGTGFLGSYIIKQLVEKGYAVRAIRRSNKLPFWIPAAILIKVEWTGPVVPGGSCLQPFEA